jgi:rhodanese-related sulfurtransferase
MPNKNILIPIIILLFTTSCNKTEQVESGMYDFLLKSLISGTVPSITVDDLKELNSDNILILDARELAEFRVSRIENAVHVGHENFDANKIDSFDRDRTVIVYCSVGVRSEIVGEKLQDAGFRDVKNLYGGIFEWVNRGEVVVDREGVTQNIHPYNRFWGIWLNKGKKAYKPEFD